MRRASFCTWSDPCLLQSIQTADPLGRTGSRSLPPPFKRVSLLHATLPLMLILPLWKIFSRVQRWRMVGEGKQTMKAVAQPLGFCLGTLCCPFVQYLQSLALSASRVTMTGFGVFNLSMHRVLGDLIFCLQVTQCTLYLALELNRVGSMGILRLD